MEEPVRVTFEFINFWSRLSILTSLVGIRPRLSRFQLQNRNSLLFFGIIYRFPLTVVKLLTINAYFHIGTLCSCSGRKKEQKLKIMKICD